MTISTGGWWRTCETTTPTVRAKNQNHYKRNREYYVQKAKRWREQNPEQSKKYMHAYYMKHKQEKVEKRRESARNWHRRFKEKHGISYETFRRRRLEASRTDETYNPSEERGRPPSLKRSGKNGKNNGKTISVNGISETRKNGEPTIGNGINGTRRKEKSKPRMVLEEPEKALAMSARYKQTHKIENRERALEYYYEHREERAAYMREYRQKRKENQ